MATFTGQLRSNEVYASLFNLIIGQVVFSDNFQKHQTLVDKAKDEAGLAGDTKIFYACDILGSDVWGADSNHPKGGVMDVEAANLLAVKRAPAPEQQALIIDTFRQCRLTTDEYMSRRAWSTPNAFAEFTSVIVGMMAECKKVYEGTLYNVFIGTTKATGSAQNISVNLDSANSGDPLYGLTGVEKEQMEAMLIARRIADLLVELGDYNRAYNDYGFMRSYADENIRVIWNSKFINKIRKIDTPTIFHRDGLVDKLDEDILPEHYFGDVNSTNVSAANNSGQYFSVLEKDYTVSSVTTHVFPGEKIPAGAAIAAGEGYTAPAKDVICKVLVKLPPLLSAFSVGTSFFNARSLTENRYLTWGHSTLEYLKAYPFITVSVK